MEVVKFVYNEQSVDFMPTANDSVMVNATQMAAIFGKDLYQFTKSEKTKEFLATCLKPANAGILGIKNKSDLIDSKQKTGTWMHRVLALKFAAWLDPQFELWVYVTIDRILLGHFKDLRDATVAKIEAEKARDRKREELLQKYPDEFAEYLELEGEYTEAYKRRVAAIKASASQMKLEFD